MSRKNHNKDADWSNDRKLKEENKKLKKQISTLRKQLSRIDVDRYQNLQELVEAQEREDKEFHATVKKQDAKTRWKCFSCEEDYLRIIVLNRLDGVFYFRRCPSCSKKTKVQRYHDGVEGPNS